MTSSFRITFALAIAACSFGAGPVAGRFRGVRYLDEVGHLGSEFDSRSSVDFKIAKASMTADGDIEFTGKDDGERKWSARFRVAGGVGWTTVWKADFDRNGRPDLMIGAYFPRNGRCIPGVTISFLMFDAHGRPNPWSVQTDIPGYADVFPQMPALLTDLEGHGRAQLVATRCEYAVGPGEDHSIAGVYEARDAVWKLWRPTNLTAIGRVDSIVLRSSPLRPRIDTLEPVEPESWPDLGNDHRQGSLMSAQITDVLPAEAGCRGIVRFGQLVDGRITLPDENDPCVEGSQNRIRLSSGVTCYGWPTVVLDGPEGREIAGASSERVVSALRKIRDQKLAVTVSGQVAAGRCSPVLVSADANGKPQ